MTDILWNKFLKPLAKSIFKPHTSCHPSSLTLVHVSSSIPVGLPAFHILNVPGASVDKRSPVFLMCSRFHTAALMVDPGKYIRVKEGNWLPNCLNKLYLNWKSPWNLRIYPEVHCGYYLAMVWKNCAWSMTFNTIWVITINKILLSLMQPFSLKTLLL